MAGHDPKAIVWQLWTCPAAQRTAFTVVSRDCAFVCVSEREGGRERGRGGEREREEREKGEGERGSNGVRVFRARSKSML